MTGRAKIVPACLPRGKSGNRLPRAGPSRKWESPSQLRPCVTIGAAPAPRSRASKETALNVAMTFVSGQPPSSARIVTIQAGLYALNLHARRQGSCQRPNQP
jgi:hypothetical protein